MILTKEYQHEQQKRIVNDKCYTSFNKARIKYLIEFTYYSGHRTSTHKRASDYEKKAKRKVASKEKIDLKMLALSNEKNDMLLASLILNHTYQNFSYVFNFNLEFDQVDLRLTIKEPLYINKKIKQNTK